MIPILLWLETDKGTRRHAERNKAVMLRAFNDAWETYKRESSSPFRRNVLDYQSATSVKHIIEKVTLATEAAPTFIYLYCGEHSPRTSGNTSVKLSGGTDLDLKQLLEALSSAALYDTVVFVDAPHISALEPIDKNPKLSICWRHERDFIHSDNNGCEPFLGAFSRYFGAAVRNAPVFSLSEILNTARQHIRDKYNSNWAGYTCLGAQRPLQISLMTAKVISSELTQSELDNFSSDNVGSFEDGLQALFDALNRPELRQEATDLATLFANSEKHSFISTQVQTLTLGRSQTNTISKQRGSMPERSYLEELLNDLVTIPTGEALIGSDPAIDPNALVQELPYHLVSHLEFQIGKHQVTNDQWAQFLTRTGGIEAFDEGTRNHPATYLSFYDALDFLSWIERGARHYDLIEPDSSLVLPSEIEWEISARGREGMLFPWGNEFRKVCNYRENSKNRVVDVGTYSPKGDSPFGLSDMAGNAWDWTRSLWGKSGRTPEFAYPYFHSDGRENIEAPMDIRRVVRGGAYYYFDWCLRSATRNVMFPLTRHSGGGFRIAKVPTTGTDVRVIQN